MKQIIKFITVLIETPFMVIGFVGGAIWVGILAGNKILSNFLEWLSS